MNLFTLALNVIHCSIIHSGHCPQARGLLGGKIMNSNGLTLAGKLIIAYPFLFFACSTLSKGFSH